MIIDVTRGQKRAFMPLYIEKVVICTGVTDALRILINKRVLFITRSRWLNCALRDNEAVYWVI